MKKNRKKNEKKQIIFDVLVFVIVIYVPFLMLIINNNIYNSDEDNYITDRDLIEYQKDNDTDSKKSKKSTEKTQDGWVSSASWGVGEEDWDK